MLHAHIFQFDRVHEVVQRHVSVAAAEPSQEWSHQTCEGHQGIAAKRAEQQIEPHHIRLQLPQCAKQAVCTAGIIERPAAHDLKAFRLRMIRRQVIAQNRQIEKWIALQFLGDMESVLTQPAGAGRKRRNQTDLHSSPIDKRQQIRCAFRTRCCRHREKQKTLSGVGSSLCAGGGRREWQSKIEGIHFSSQAFT
jgi:hypothetical protein